MTLDVKAVSRMVEDHTDRLFEELEDKRGDMKPSEVAGMLEGSSPDLGDWYRDWFEQGDEEWE